MTENPSPADLDRWRQLLDVTPPGIEAGCFGGETITDERAFADWAFDLKAALRQSVAAVVSLTEHADTLQADGHWYAHGRWVAEHCAEQPEEPEPLFQVDLEANAATIARIHNKLVARASAAEAALADAGFHHAADSGWHRVEPGIDVDMTADGRRPDPRWCNVCGEAVAVLDTNQETNR